MAKRTIYRDSKTGRFASASTWRRSRAQGGTRFHRGTLRRVEPAKKLPRPAPRPRRISETEEYVFRVTYKSRAKGHDALNEIHMRAPAGLSREKLESGLKAWAAGRKPKGWQEPKGIYWGKKRKFHADKESKDTAKAFVHSGSTIAAKPRRDRSAQ
jgi:hypothetical protein